MLLFSPDFMDRIAVTITSPLHSLGGVRFVSAELTREGEFVPDSFRLTVEATNIDDFNALFSQWRGEILNNTLVTGTLANNDSVSIRLGPNTKVEPEGDTRLTLEFVVQDYEVHTAAEMGRGAEYRFRLTNLQIEPSGDEGSQTRLSPDPAAGGFTRHNRVNRIRFTLAGRQWSLTDDFFDEWQNLSDSDRSRILLSGTLSTVSVTDDPVAEEKEVATIADDLAFLLSFALGRDIKWVTCHSFTSTGRLAKSQSRFLCLSTFGAGGFPPLGNWTRGQLREFIETAYASYSTDLEWWRRTLDLFSQVVDARAADLRAVIVNILLDRASTRILVGKDLGNQIEAGLNAKLDDPAFKQELQKLLTSLTAKWAPDRTDRLIETIKQWNSSPSFPKRIAAAYQEVRLEPPKGKMLTKRHLLVHLGDPPADGSIFEYSLELECRVLMLLLRLLNYENQFFHPFFKRVTSLREHLVS